MLCVFVRGTPTNFSVRFLLVAEKIRREKTELEC
jgi:hypothetical protein